ncbi:MAG: hypothetical protein M4579_004733 [Chaenotheca gracillima]|nr:MAG: hypothetical protein M4579_004733 [Chaenotheca gracillima]
MEVLGSSQGSMDGLEISTTMGARLNNLPARPPTPPKEHPRRSLRTARSDAPLDSPQSAIYTPPNISPPSSAEPNSQSSKRGKKVNFTGWNTHHRLPEISNLAKNEPENQLKILPPSRERKSFRSILKPSVGSTVLPITPSSPLVNVENDLVQNGLQFSQLLESLVQQLAGEVRTSRVDAYVTLASTLKAYDGVPGSKVIKDKIGLLTQFIRRDVTLATADSTTQELVLPTQALKLLAILIWTPEFAASFSDDFNTFVLDRAASSIGDARTPKAIVNSYMHILSLQKFGPKVLTNDRANRLVSHLAGIEGRVSGNGIIAERLVVFQRLVVQAKQVMISRVGDWLDHLFSGMLSSTKEVRSRALAFGLEAALALGTVPQVSRHVRETFKRESGHGKFADYLAKRLTEWFKAKDDGPYIAQVWSVVVLFLRSRPNQLEQWEHMKTWLLILQKCFNSGEIVIKFQANIAWGRLIFAVDPNEHTSQMMIRMLRQPIIGQLERKLADKNAKKCRKFACNSLSTLLYYSLRPSSTHAQLDLYWDEYVHPIVGRVLLVDNSLEPGFGCQILASLFDSTTSKGWDINRANESGGIKPEELPRLEPKWVRSRAKKILETVKMALVRPKMWEHKPGEISLIERIWDGFTKTISDASNKEVKVSTQLTESIASILNTFQSLWNKKDGAVSILPEADDGTLICRSHALVSMTVKNLGAFCFTESLLQRNEDGFLDAANSATSDFSQAKTPILFLLQLFGDSASGSELNKKLKCAVKQVLKMCCESRSSKTLQLQFLRGCAEVVHEQNQEVRAELWDIVGDLTLSALSSSDGFGESETQLVVEILSIVPFARANNPSSAWPPLLERLVTTTRRASGDREVAGWIIRPLADALLYNEEKEFGSSVLYYFSLLLDKANFPRTDIPHRPGRRRVGEAVVARQLSSFLEPLRDLLEAVSGFLEMLYSGSLPLSAESKTFLIALTNFIGRWPEHQFITMPQRLQTAMGLWFEDVEGMLNGQSSSVVQQRQEIQNLWMTISRTINRLPEHNSEVLESLDSCIASALQSRRRVIANDAIKLWNSKFGTVEDLEYPPKVTAALQRLRPTVKLELPNFPEAEPDSTLAPPLVFTSSQEDLDESQRRTPVSAKTKRVTRSSATGSAETRPSTPSRKVIKSPKITNSIRRLRHEDSQIEFMTIDSLSSPQAADIESQILTVHQREVRERQQAEAAAMFPDLRSSPSNRSRESKKANLPPLTLSSDWPASEPMVVDGPTTPELVPPSNGPLDDFIVSSPTPRRGSREMIIQSEEDQIQSDARAGAEEMDPPSSPPQAAQQTDGGRSGSVEQSSAPELESHDVTMDEPSALVDQQDEEHVNNVQDADLEHVGRQSNAEDVEMSDSFEDYLRQSHDRANDKGIPTSSTGKLSSAREGLGLSPALPIEIPATPELERPHREERFVDAPSSPAISPLEEDGDKAVFHDALQSPDESKTTQKANRHDNSALGNHTKKALPRSQSMVNKIISPFKDPSSKLSFWPGLGSLQRRLSQSSFSLTPPKDNADDDSEHELTNDDVEATSEHAESHTSETGNPPTLQPSPILDESWAKHLEGDSFSQESLELSDLSKSRKRKSTAVSGGGPVKKLRLEVQTTNDSNGPQSATENIRPRIENSGVPQRDISPVASRTRKRQNQASTQSASPRCTAPITSRNGSPFARSPLIASRNASPYERALLNSLDEPTSCVGARNVKSNSPFFEKRRSTRLSQARMSAPYEAGGVEELVRASISPRGTQTLHAAKMSEALNRATGKDSPNAATEEKVAQSNASALASPAHSTRSKSNDINTTNVQLESHAPVIQPNPPTTTSNDPTKPEPNTTILTSLQNILQDVQNLRSTSVDTAEVRKMDDVLFQIRREIFRVEGADS